MNMRTKIIKIADRNSMVTGPSIQQFVTLPAAPWEQADNEREFAYENLGSKVSILGTTFANVSRAAKDLKVDRSGLANALMFDKLDQYVDGQLAREKSNVRPNKTFTALYEKMQSKKASEA